MANDHGLPRFDQLLKAWHEGDADERDLRELEALLRQDADCRRSLVNLALIDVHLSGSQTLRRRTRSRLPEVIAAGLVAAAAIVAVTVALVRSGQRGEPRREIEARGPGWERVGLADGGEMRLAPGARGVLESDGAFDLTGGGGSFVTIRPMLIRVALGSVRSEGTAEFTVDASARALTVGVATGSVEVAYAGVRHLVTPGERIVYGLPAEGAWEDVARWPRLAERVKVSLTEAIAAALVAETGIPVSAALEDEEDVHALVFAVELAQGRQTREVAIDAMSGRVVENEVEGGDLSGIAGSAKRTLAEAVRIALAKVPGIACGGVCERREGRTSARIAIVTEKRVIEVVVDLTTGAVSRISVI